MQQQFHDLNQAFITKKWLSIATRQQLLTGTRAGSLPSSESRSWQHPSLKPSHSSLLHFSDHVFVFIQPDWDGKEDWTLEEWAVVKSSSCLFSLLCEYWALLVCRWDYDVCWVVTKCLEDLDPGVWVLLSPAGSRRPSGQWITLMSAPATSISQSSLQKSQLGNLHKWVSLTKVANEEPLQVSPHCAKTDILTVMTTHGSYCHQTCVWQRLPFTLYWVWWLWKS